MIKLLISVFLLQFAVSCASHHHDRFPSSVDDAHEEFLRKNPRFRR